MRLRVLALAFAAIGGTVASGCGSSSNPANPSPSSGSLVTVQINNFVYSPDPVTVKVGQQINWKNNDSVTHTATLDGVFNNVISPMSAQGAPVTMNTAGTFTYHCTIHPNMSARIVVQP